jgi:polar amino acid transport system substrate-binding protein
MKLRSFCSVPVVMAVAGCLSLSDRPTPAALSELASTGKLRVGVASAPTQSAFFVVKDANGQPRGVTVDLGKELARRLGVPVEFMVAPSSGELVNALSAGTLDVSFMPVDDERKTKVDFGPAYFVIESTYLVRPGSDIKTLADVDRANVRVVGIANTATIRSAGRSLKSTTIAPAKSVDEAMELLRSAKVDAFALTRDSLPLLAARLPGSRILDGSFLQTGIGIAVPKNRPNALAYATAFMEDAKASGVVRRALDDAGFKDLAVASASPGR